MYSGQVQLCSQQPVNDKPCEVSQQWGPELLIRADIKQEQNKEQNISVLQNFFCICIFGLGTNMMHQ